MGRFAEAVGRTYQPGEGAMDEELRADAESLLQRLRDEAGREFGGSHKDRRIRVCDLLLGMVAGGGGPEDVIRWICGRYQLIGAEQKGPDFVNTSPSVDEIVAAYHEAVPLSAAAAPPSVAWPVAEFERNEHDAPMVTTPPLWELPPGKYLVFKEEE